MPQDDSKTKTIGKSTYRVYMLDPFVASDLFNDLVSIIAPALAAAKSAGGGEAILEEAKSDDLEGLLDGLSFERPVSLFFERFNKSKQREIINILMKVTRVVSDDGQTAVKLEDIFAAHFRGRLRDLYLWLGFALQVQFSDFFEGALPAIKGAIARVLRPGA